MTLSRQYRTTLASRERNRIHARKTRQRKKEQMQNLQARAEELKQEQIRLRQIINEKNTASILVGLFARSSETDEINEDPRVEGILRRSLEEIPDSSSVPELPALILPGNHASKKIKAPSIDEATSENFEDGIDYDLLGKDRSICTPEELDRIRRERNRMHAKRTRDRKRLFTEQMSDICRQLEEENQLLQEHLSKIDPDYVFSPLISADSSSSAPAVVDQSSVSSHSTPTVSTPRMQPSHHEKFEVSENPSVAPKSLSCISSSPKQLDDHISTLLRVADAFEKSVNDRKRGLSSDALSFRKAITTTQVPISEILSNVARNLVALSSDESSASGESYTVSHGNDELDQTCDMPPIKRQRRLSASHIGVISHSITAHSAKTTAVGC